MSHEPPHQDLHCLQIQLYKSLVVKELILLQCIITILILINILGTAFCERGHYSEPKGQLISHCQVPLINRTDGYTFRGSYTTIFASLCSGWSTLKGKTLLLQSRSHFKELPHPEKQAGICAS